jgi:hypothetical protein
MYASVAESAAYLRDVNDALAQITRELIELGRIKVT